MSRVRGWLVGAIVVGLGAVVGCADSQEGIPIGDGGTGGGGIGGDGGTGGGGIGGDGGAGGMGGAGGVAGTGGAGGVAGMGGTGGMAGMGGVGGMAGMGGFGGMAGMGGAGGMAGMGGVGGMAGMGGSGGMAGTGGAGGMAGMGGVGGMAGMGGFGGMAGMGGSGGCPAGADASVVADLGVDLFSASSYDDPSTGLRVSPGVGSGTLFGTVNGLGTNAIGSSYSIQSGSPNESIVFEVFQSDGSTLGVAQTATNVSISARGLPNTTEFLLIAEDIDGFPLGSAIATTSGGSPFDVSAQIPGDIHRLIVEGTTNPVAPFSLSFTNSCLGFDPIP